MASNEKDRGAALVVGGSSGFGLATAARLVESQIPVILVGRDPQKLEHAAAELGERVEIWQADIVDSSEREALIRRVEGYAAAFTNFRMIASDIWGTEDTVARINTANAD